MLTNQKKNKPPTGTAPVISAFLDRLYQGSAIATMLRRHKL
jgi:hypothetical protein